MAWKWLSLSFNDIIHTMRLISQNKFFELLLWRKLSSIMRIYTQVFEGLFNISYRHTSENFCSFQTSLKFGFLVTVCYLCVKLFCLVLKWNSTLYQIYWLANLQSLKLVCFVVENTGSQNIHIPDFYWQDGNVYLIEEPSCLADLCKHFKSWLSYFYPSSNYIELTSQSNSKTRLDV